MNEQQICLFSFEDASKKEWNWPAFIEKSANCPLILVDIHPELESSMKKLLADFLAQRPIDLIVLHKRLSQLIEDYNAEAEAPLINDTWVELEWLIEDGVQDSKDYIFDQIYAYFSIISSLLVKGKLSDRKWVDARDFIHTDDNYSAARVDKVKPLPNGLFISQAKVGVTEENTSTTNIKVDKFWG